MKQNNHRKKLTEEQILFQKGEYENADSDLDIMVLNELTGFSRPVWDIQNFHELKDKLKKEKDEPTI